MFLELVMCVVNEEIMCMFAMENTKLHINHLWTLTPKLFHGLGYMHCSIEFIIAQIPQQIKGLMMCITLETFGMLSICGYAIDEVFLHFPFQHFQVVDRVNNEGRPVVGGGTPLQHRVVTLAQAYM